MLSLVLIQMIFLLILMIKLIHRVVRDKLGPRDLDASECFKDFGFLQVSTGYLSFFFFLGSQLQIVFEVWVKFPENFLALSVDKSDWVFSEDHDCPFQAEQNCLQLVVLLNTFFLLLKKAQMEILVLVQYTLDIDSYENLHDDQLGNVFSMDTEWFETLFVIVGVAKLESSNTVADH